MEKVPFDKIIIENSELETTVREGGCPFWYAADSEERSCKIKDVKCRYGCTEIVLPDNCPLQTKEVMIKVSVCRDVWERE